MPFDQILDDGEPYAMALHVALPWPVDPEGRIEDLRERLGRDPFSGIDHRDPGKQ